jgi:hypothetical protein
MCCKLKFLGENGWLRCQEQRCKQIEASIPGSAHMLIISPTHLGNIVGSAGIYRFSERMYQYKRKLLPVQGA